MGFQLTSGDYVLFLGRAARKIAENGDYISALDAATGDGDHWANINMGFEHLVAASDEMRAMPICDVFKKIGMLMMSKIGGSSGILTAARTWPPPKSARQGGAFERRACLALRGDWSKT